MGLPGWSLDEPTVIGDLTLLPRGPRWGATNPNLSHGELIMNRTTGGKRYRYRLFHDTILEYGFRFPQEENVYFAAIYDETEDGTLPFYWVPDSDVMGVVYHVWLEDPDYSPQNIGEPGADDDGELQFWFDWVLRMGVEVPDVEIDA